MRDVVEIGLGKNAQRGYHLDDVAIVPLPADPARVERRGKPVQHPRDAEVDPHLDPVQPHQRQEPLLRGEQADLVAFLNSLTDEGLNRVSRPALP